MFISILGFRPRASASVREHSRMIAVCPMRCAFRIGLDGGRLGGALYRCAVVIGGESRVLGSAVPWGLVGRTWSGCRNAVGIGAESVVWVALCRCDWWGGCPLGGAVPL